jgi:ribosomal protein S18 acetylase RimI-like enzyme
MVEPSVELARLVVKDIDVVEPLWRSLRDEHQRVGPRGIRWWPGDRSWEIRRSRYVQWLAEPGTLAVVAWMDEVPVGYAVTRVHEGPDDTWVTGELIGELESLAVAVGHRGAGIGSQLMSAVIEHLHEWDTSDLWLNVVVGNEQALHFYAKYGLRPLMTTLGASVRLTDG